MACMHQDRSPVAVNTMVVKILLTDGMLLKLMMLCDKDRRNMF